VLTVAQNEPFDSIKQRLSNPVEWCPSIIAELTVSTEVHCHGLVLSGSSLVFCVRVCWVHIQGADPATDLRGCGMLGLLQLLFLHTHNKENTASIYKLRCVLSTGKTESLSAPQAMTPSDTKHVCCASVSICRANLTPLCE